MTSRKFFKAEVLAFWPRPSCWPSLHEQSVSMALLQARRKLRKTWTVERALLSV
jgi:hypothetical protein